MKHTYYGNVMVGIYRQEEKTGYRPCIIINEEHVIDIVTGKPPVEIWDYKKLMHSGVLPICICDNVVDGNEKQIIPSSTFNKR